MKVDVLVSLQGFGLSLVNNEWRKEVLYMGVVRSVTHSCTVIFYVHHESEN